MPYNTLVNAISRFKATNILVLGDIIIDQFLWGIATRISPEAPVPIVDVQQEEYMLGGSANVLRNIISLGGRASLCGVIGADSMGRKVTGFLEALQAPTSGLVVGSRPTSLKTRVVAQGQQVVRFDREKVGPVSQASLNAILQFLEETLCQYDAVVVSDYAKGVIGSELMLRLQALLVEIRLKTQKPLPLIVDPKPSNIRCFKGATIVTPNQHEAEQIAQMKICDEESLNLVARKICNDIACKAVLITRGDQGMALLQGDSRIISIPAVGKEVFDVTGAGDTVAATLSLALASGCSGPEAAVLANYAAGIVVGKVGTASLNEQELREVVLSDKGYLH